MPADTSTPFIRPWVVALLGGGAIVAGTLVLLHSTEKRLDQPSWYARAKKLGARQKVPGVSLLRPGECLSVEGLVTGIDDVVVGYWTGPLPHRLPWCANMGPILEYKSPAIRFKIQRVKRRKKPS